MKLSTDSIFLLDQLVQSAMVADLQKMIVEKGSIRGIDAKNSVVLVTTDNVPDLGGKQAAINRISELSARLSLVKAQGSLDIDATVSTTNADDISLLDLSSGKTKAQFRCAAVEAMKGVPKSIKDNLVWELKIDGKLLPILTQGVSAMGADRMTIASKDGKLVSIECVDSNKDVFTTEVEDAPVWIGAGAPASSFCLQYPAKTLLALLKESVKMANPVIIKLGEGGILSLKMNGFDFFVLPLQ